jgi:membrane-bound metal-dependent hydrolase YbcI (DUF457 family)
MKIPEHIALSYLLAQLGPAQAYGPTGTALMIVAGMLPDLDGVSILGGWRCHLRYHRKVGHGLPVTLLGPLILACAGSGVWTGPAFWALWGWLQLSLALHLLVDLLFYNWKVQLLWPLSPYGIGCGLVAWNDLVPTAILYAGAALALAWPSEAPLAAGLALMLLSAYTAWRAGRPRPREGWAGWVTGDWARRSPRLCRWLTGDFVT